MAVNRGSSTGCNKIALSDYFSDRLPVSSLQKDEPQRHEATK
ncbi:Uncharacterized protein dnm_098250 [Desulfonema magnum]|uniref:Uncharacterized protein n=1 Tax=Desulfonema magnum TaxID=45655 RepID=A0A975BXS9_9BACT|nr:Uncharacterized protein dnm_098250 [Desulfonema magnum]